jgi:hypothetical protein
MPTGAGETPAIPETNGTALRRTSRGTRKKIFPIPCNLPSRIEQ